MNGVYLLVRTSSLERALRSELYSIWTSAFPPPVERYVYVLVVFATDPMMSPRGALSLGSLLRARIERDSSVLSAAAARPVGKTHSTVTPRSGHANFVGACATAPESRALPTYTLPNNNTATHQPLASSISRLFGFS